MEIDAQALELQGPISFVPLSYGTPSIRVIEEALIGEATEMYIFGPSSTRVETKKETGKALIPPGLEVVDQEMESTVQPTREDTYRLVRAIVDFQKEELARLERYISPDTQQIVQKLLLLMKVKEWFQSDCNNPPSCEIDNIIKEERIASAQECEDRIKTLKKQLGLDSESELEPKELLTIYHPTRIVKACTMIRDQLEKFGML